MASAVADLEAGLQAMLNLKPPGVSGSRINNLTTLCVANIQSESVLIQKIYTHFKKTPRTHKLGVLYVVDSVTRKWLEQAKTQGQAVNGSAQDGTFAAGVHRVTELMPVMMNDIFSTIPDEQKEKIKKLLDIWEKGQTFPLPMIEGFKEKLSVQQPQKSTTPPGSPPNKPMASVLGNGFNIPTAAPAAKGSSILEALANIARQSTTTTPSNPGLPAPAASYNLPHSLASSIPPQQQQQPVSYPTSSQPVNVPSMPFSLPQMPGQNAQLASLLGNPGAHANSYGATGLPGAGAGAVASGLDSSTQQQILLIKALAEQGVPFDKIPALIQSMTGNAGAGAPNAQSSAPATQNPYAAGQQSWGGPASRHGQGPDRGFQDGVRSPPKFGRTRSRSPDRGWGDGTRGGRDYRRDTPPRGRNDDRTYNGRSGNDYRQRSPQRRDQSPSPVNDLAMVDKWVDFDRSLPSGTIKVLSRTLFVGGVTCSDSQLRSLFSRFGIVQTCIVNKDKRHAFVKMMTRKDAVVAKEGTEDGRNLELPLRTRWGVGFGPRDCSDYSTGISVIPIARLTEADRKWMLTAEYGGSGGRAIETGLCVEEPDIEIGAGVSSKAISRRMQTDKGGSNGPKSTRHRDEEPVHARRRDDWEDNTRRPRGDHTDGGQQSAMSTFPFGIGTLPNGMPSFPAGFSFPDPGAGGN